MHVFYFVMLQVLSGPLFLITAVAMDTWAHWMGLVHSVPFMIFSWVTHSDTQSQQDVYCNTRDSLTFTFYMKIEKKNYWLFCKFCSQPMCMARSLSLCTVYIKCVYNAWYDRCPLDLIFRQSKVKDDLESEASPKCNKLFSGSLLTFPENVIKIRSYHLELLF